MHCYCDYNSGGKTEYYYYGQEPEERWLLCNGEL
jgi:hypothetical protein